VAQIQTGNWALAGKPAAIAVNEVEAYDSKLRLSERLGLSPAEKASILGDRNRWYREVDARYRARLAKGNYQLLPGDR
jgi:hypothetical protein